jgi:hypothetical protein
MGNYRGVLGAIAAHDIKELQRSVIGYSILRNYKEYYTLSQIYPCVSGIDN